MIDENEFTEAIDYRREAKTEERFAVRKTTDLGNIHCLEMALELYVWVSHKWIAETYRLQLSSFLPNSRFALSMLVLGCVYRFTSIIWRLPEIVKYKINF